MKSLIKVLALGAVVAASSSVAFADPITGSFSVSGSDSYTSSAVTFSGGAIGANGCTGTGCIYGTFLNYLTDGQPVTFTSPVSYIQGQNTPGAPAQVFSVSENGETFDFDVTSYNANYQDNGELLTITGSGFFTGSGAVAYDNTPGMFLFSSQNVGTDPRTTFSASAGATAVTPEPNSLILMGTGLIGAAGLLFMRRRNTMDMV